ncbi:hypothetical protein [Kribbella sp. NPDC051770]|uniref:hypothetical protein n=1 Tax=Kribbella sp. NPDC051770 TaxID=3155413 RepID=UPI0034427645
MTLAIRLLVALLFLEALVVGVWNTLAPRSFYTDFPTVDINPPFSEHFSRDLGAVMLGLAIVLGFALVRPVAHHLIPAALAYTAFAIPHFFFHVTNMENATVGQAILLTSGNALFAVLGLLVLLLTAIRDRGLYGGSRREESRDDTGADRGRRAERLL